MKYSHNIRDRQYVINRCEELRVKYGPVDPESISPDCRWVGAGQTNESSPAASPLSESQIDPVRGAVAPPTRPDPPASVTDTLDLT